MRMLRLVVLVHDRVQTQLTTILLDVCNASMILLFGYVGVVARLQDLLVGVSYSESAAGLCPGRRDEKPGHVTYRAGVPCQHGLC
jgi:hypothetical protein